METASPQVPPLRPELQIYPGPADSGGAPTWTVHDPVRDRNFRIGWLEGEILSRWGSGTASEIASRVTLETTLNVSVDNVIAFGNFLSVHGLLRRIDAEVVAKFIKERDSQRHSILTWLLHNYLFIRIPLIKPDGFLQKTVGITDFFFSKTFIVLLFVTAIADAYLVMRQWDLLISTFPYFFSFQGAVMYGSALAIAKITHEFAHAYAAKRSGCRVPTMGAALMVLWPVLYTDTSDAWKLTSRNSRLSIDAAGIIAEGVIAILSIFVWAVLPDGIFKSCAMILATVTVVTSFVVNVNPFMRFDGYYILSDLIGVANLQPRSFALSRWKMRRVLWGADIAPPEFFDKKTRVILIFYGYAVWIYRLILFTGIAAMVYHFFFKVIGIILFCVEIGWFVMLPIYRELVAWWGMRKIAKARNSLYTLLAACSAISCILIPFHGSVFVPAILESASHVRVYSPVPGLVVSVNVSDGQRVRSGDLLFSINSPDLDNSVDIQKLKIVQIKHNIDHLTSLEDVKNRLRVLGEQLASAMEELSGLERQKERLRVTAHVDGFVFDIFDGIRPGVWISPSTSVLTIADTSLGQIVGYVSEADLSRINQGSFGRFFADGDLFGSIDVTVRDIDKSASRALTLPYVSSTNGGDVAARKDDHGKLLPNESVYRVIFDVKTTSFDVRQVRKGTVVLEGERISLFSRAWNLFGQVIMRESGF
jgi:putative peptide zinc metalloprotease protein